MNLQRVEVQCYSGSSADERPRLVIVDGRKHSVLRLLSQSTEQTVESKDWTTRFTVLTEESLIIELIRTTGGEWYLVSIKD